MSHKMNGFELFKNYLSLERQEQVLQSIESILDESPIFINTMWNGQPYKVANTNFGKYGWFSDTKGFHYQKIHPETKQPWPPIPDIILQITKELIEKTEYINFVPESCYINFYSESGSLGHHRDESEKNLTAPIISISLGNSAEFYLGGKTREDKKEKIILESGDCYVMGGESRLYYHSVKKILCKTSPLLPEGGRVNLTIRQVY